MAQTRSRRGVLKALGATALGALGLAGPIPRTTAQTTGCQTDSDCPASDQCHLAGTCDTSTGQCSNPPAPDGANCTPASGGSGICQSGTCVAATCDCANLNFCSQHGTCTLSCTCACDSGYSGPECSDQITVSCVSYTDCATCQSHASDGCVFCANTVSGAAGVCMTAADCLIPQVVCCPAGSYLDAQTGCTTCPAGTYSAQPNSSSCTACPPGSYSSQTGSTSCADCAAGTYQPNTGSITCISCPADSYQSDTGGTTCLSCPAGQVSAVGSASCTTCPAGTYDAGTTCAVCPAGTYSDQPGSSTCTVCPAGSFQANPGSTACPVCPANTYQPNTGSTDSLACPDGMVSAPGSTSCTCPAGQLSCGGQCVSPTKDKNNCGGCGIRCGAKGRCQNGTCTSK